MLVFIPKIMANREPFKFKWTLVAWNALLAIFSAVGTYYVVPPAVESLSHGVHYHLCVGEEELV